MRQHAIATPRMRVHRRRRPAVPRLVRYIEDRFLALPIGAAIALVWANTAAETYFVTAQTMRFVVNEIAMAFFFGPLWASASCATPTPPPAERNGRGGPGLLAC